MQWMLWLVALQIRPSPQPKYQGIKLLLMGLQSGKPMERRNLVDKL